MRQVPHYLIIGNGRMATHFCTYLKQLLLPHSQWARKTQSTKTLVKLLQCASHVLLLIKDSAIADFATTYCYNNHYMLIHFSGSFYSEKIIGAHPLMTFGKTPYSFSQYQQIPFIIDEGAPPLKTLLPGLSNPYYFLSPSTKGYYHALCVLSGNFTTLLWHKMFSELSKTCKINPEAGALYLKQTCSNLLNDYQNALTGPLVRNDHSTIEANLNALQHDPYQEVYRAFCNAYKESI